MRVGKVLETHCVKVGETHCVKVGEEAERGGATEPKGQEVFQVQR